MNNLFPRTSASVKAETTALTVRTPALPPALAASDLMTPAERGELRTLERTVERGIETFLDVGRALLEIRDRRLYREEFTSFEAYCLERWHKSSRWARYHIEAAEVVNNLLGAPGGVEAPKTESQARPLARLPKEQQAQAWEAAKRAAAAGKQPVTARHVEEAVDRIAPRPSRKETKGTKGREARGLDSSAEAPEFELELQAPSYASPAMRSILGQAGDIVQRMGALDQMLSEAHDATCLNLLRLAREKLDKIVAIYVEGREPERPRPKVQSPTPKASPGPKRTLSMVGASDLSAGGPWFVVCRDPLKGATSPTAMVPRYATNGGWSSDPEKAVKYNRRPDAVAAAAHHGDKVVGLVSAVKRFKSRR